MLFGCGDDKLTLRDLINKQTGEHVALNVPSDHVNAFSAHLIASLSPDSENPYAYPCLIEKVLGVPKTNLMLLMNKILRERMNEEVYNEKKTVTKSWPHFSLIGRPSKFIKRNRSEARIKGFILTKPKVEQRLPDDFPKVEYIEEKIYIRIQAVPYNEESRGMLQWVASFARKNNFAHMRVQLQDPHRGVYQTEPYDPAADAQEFLTIHHEAIRIEERNHFEPKIREDVVKAMVNAFEKNSAKW